MSRLCVLLIAAVVCSVALSSPVPKEAVSRAGSVASSSAAFSTSSAVATARTHKKKHGFGFPLYPGLYGYPLGLSYPLYGGFGYPSLGYSGLYGGFGYPLSYGLGGLSPYGGLFK